MVANLFIYLYFSFRISTNTQGRLPFDDPSIRNLLTKVKQGRYRMPDFPEPIQELISRMLTVDPSQRIKIAEIKETRAFRMFYPEGYVFPKPLPVPFISDPIDPATVPPATYSVLRCIGYASDQEITDELTSPTHTMAKVFAYMLSHSISVDALNWPTDNAVEVIPEEAFMVSPDLKAISSLNASDPFRRRRAIPSVSSPETFSFAEKQFGGIFPSDTEFEDQCQLFDQIYLPLENVMAGLQKCLVDNNYEFLHPDDMHLFARNTTDDSYVIFEAKYLDIEQIQLKLHPLKIERHNFDALVSFVSESIRDVIREYSTPSFEEGVDVEIDQN
jgi:BR serine/threonine kinase